MNKISIIQKSLLKLLSLESRINIDSDQRSLLEDIAQKDEIIRNQTLTLEQIYKSRLWRIYLIFRKIKNCVKPDKE